MKNLPMLKHLRSLEDSVDSSNIYVRDWRGTEIPVQLNISEDASKVYVES